MVVKALKDTVQEVDQLDLDEIPTPPSVPARKLRYFEFTNSEIRDFWVSKFNKEAAYCFYYCFLPTVNISASFRQRGGETEDDGRVGSSSARYVD